MTTSTVKPGQPWGRACGALAACVATLAGVIQEMDPEVILLRAAVSGMAVTLIVGAFRLLVATATPADAEDD